MPRRRRLTRTESQARTRVELLAAAERVFRRRGYERASVAEIADEAGYSHGAVYSNFASKDDLFLALYERWVADRVAEVDARWAGEATLSDRARAAADDWMARLAADPAPFLLRLELTVRAAHDRELQERLATRVGAVPLALRRLIETFAEDAALELPAEDVALAFQSLSIGLALEALANPAGVRRGAAGDFAARLVDALGQRQGSARP